jgi:trimethylamine--corrinoid protein Co-methyltransferase
MVNAGMFATGETAAFEQLLLDNELFKLARRIAQGVSVDLEHLCLDSFGRAGPMGNYLEDASTLGFLRSGEWSTSPILTREKYQNWKAKGSKPVVQKAADMVEILKRREDVGLEAHKSREIEAIIRGFEQSPR